MAENDFSGIDGKGVNGCDQQGTERPLEKISCRPSRARFPRNRFGKSLPLFERSPILLRANNNDEHLPGLRWRPAL
jgi:hypothetical protein